jgi:hypothetical protein
VTKRARIILGVLIAAIMVGIVAIVISFRALEPRMHDWVTENLSKALDSKIELGAVHVRWFPLQLHAHDLTVRHRGRTDIPPLLVVKSFIVDLKPSDLRSSTIDRVWVDGLEVSIPPKDPNTGRRPMPNGQGQNDDAESSGLVIRELIATNTKLTIVPAQANKAPKIWDVHDLTMENLRAGQPASFVASINNPIPEGRIEASGKFGPWQRSEPGTTALSGEYTFAADLGSIPGLSGKLDAQGEMSGTIEQIATKGHTHTPDFRLTELEGASLPLDTSYDAVVDGTKGDVELHGVDVTLGRSHFHARGVIEGTRGIKGKRVVVNLTSKSANLGELLQFVSSKGTPPADGTLTIDAALDLPQGPQPVLDRVALEGSVRADRLKFTNVGVQDKIDELSRRAQGHPADASIDDVASGMAAKFTLRRGVFTYQALSFTVEGANIHLDGTHSLKSRTLNLAGVALLKAPVSKMVTGFKSWLLKPLDPLFRHNGATRLVIRVEGTQDQPKVGLDFKKTIKGE